EALVKFLRQPTAFLLVVGQERPFFQRPALGALFVLLAQLGQLRLGLIAFPAQLLGCGGISLALPRVLNLFQQRPALGLPGGGLLLQSFAGGAGGVPFAAEHFHVRLLTADVVLPFRILAAEVALGGGELLLPTFLGRLPRRVRLFLERGAFALKR